MGILDRLKGLWVRPSLKATRVHAWVLGEGWDTVRVDINGVGLLWGLGLWRWVDGTRTAFAVRRFGGARARFVLLTLRGIRWASAPLGPRVMLRVPTVPKPATPILPQPPVVRSRVFPVASAWVPVNVRAVRVDTITPATQVDNQESHGL